MTSAVDSSPGAGKIFIRDKEGKPTEVRAGDIIYHRKSKHGNPSWLDGECEVISVTPAGVLELKHVETDTRIVVPANTSASLIEWRRRPPL